MVLILVLINHHDACTELGFAFYLHFLPCICSFLPARPQFTIITSLHPPTRPSARLLGRLLGGPPRANPAVWYAKSRLRVPSPCSACTSSHPKKKLASQTHCVCAISQDMPRRSPFSSPLLPSLPSVTSQITNSLTHSLLHANPQRQNNTSHSSLSQSSPYTAPPLLPPAPPPLLGPPPSILSKNSAGILGMYFRSRSRFTPPNPAP